jgi:ATP-binding cassette subfamily B protein
VKRLETLFDPFEPAEGKPPETLWAYGRWALRGAGPAIGLLTLVSVLAGIASRALMPGLYTRWGSCASTATCWARR